MSQLDALLFICQKGKFELVKKRQSKELFRSPWGFSSVLSFLILENFAPRLSVLPWAIVKMRNRLDINRLFAIWEKKNRKKVQTLMLCVYWTVVSNDSKKKQQGKKNVITDKKLWHYILIQIEWDQNKMYQ